MCWKSCSVIIFLHNSIISKYFDTKFRNLQFHYHCMLSDIALLFTFFGNLLVVTAQLPTDGRNLCILIPKCLSLNVHAG